MLTFVEKHPGEEPTQEFPIHRREEQKRQSRTVIAAAGPDLSIITVQRLSAGWFGLLC